MDKEIKKIYDIKVIERPLGIENRLEFLSEKIAGSIEPGKKRFVMLKKSIDEKFPPNSPERGALDGFTAVTFDTAFELFFTGNNSSLIIELQGILERFCGNALADLLPIDDIAQKIIIDSYEKKTLFDFAPYFQKLAIWDETEVKFAIKLTSIRNGIAHKNIKLVSKYLNDGKQQHPSSIHEITAKTDCIPFIIETLGLILKATKVTASAFIKNPRLRARYDRYGQAIGMIFNMFCLPPVIHMDKVDKELFLNDFFAPLFLVSGDGLSVYLRKFKALVAEFHESLGKDDIRANELHRQLSNLGGQIVHAMRAELKVDADRNFFLTPKTISMDEIWKVKKERNLK